MFVIGNLEVDSVLSGQYFLTMTLHRKEHSNGENFQLPSLWQEIRTFFSDFSDFYTKIVVFIWFFDLYESGNPWESGRGWVKAQGGQLKQKGYLNEAYLYNNCFSDRPLKAYFGMLNWTGRKPHLSQTIESKKTWQKNGQKILLGYILKYLQ